MPSPGSPPAARACWRSMGGIARKGATVDAGGGTKARDGAKRDLPGSPPARSPAGRDEATRGPRRRRGRPDLVLPGLHARRARARSGGRSTGDRARPARGESAGRTAGSALSRRARHLGGAPIRAGHPGRGWTASGGPVGTEHAPSIEARDRPRPLRSASALHALEPRADRRRRLRGPSRSRPGIRRAPARGAPARAHRRRGPGPRGAGSGRHRHRRPAREGREPVDRETSRAGPRGSRVPCGDNPRARPDPRPGGADRHRGVVGRGRLRLDPRQRLPARPGAGDRDLHPRHESPATQPGRGRARERNPSGSTRRVAARPRRIAGRPDGEPLRTPGVLRPSQRDPGGPGPGWRPPGSGREERPLLRALHVEHAVGPRRDGLPHEPAGRLPPPQRCLPTLDRRGDRGRNRALSRADRVRAGRARIGFLRSGAMTGAPSIDRHLAELPADPDERERAVAAMVKAHLSEVRRYLETLHRSSRSGREVNEKNSDLTDRLVRRLFGLAEEIHLARGGQLESGVAVIAVGGYARREMSIYSDVDLLVLYREDLTPFVRYIAERMQYWLWDAGVTIGCATRTIEETVELGLEDVTVRTAVLTARYLCGDGEFFHLFADRMRDELLPDPWAFVSEQQALMRERRLDYGDTLFLLQPNVKEGAGTLRDYH